MTRVKVGEEFLVRLRLRATQRDRYQQIAVVDLLPGGVEAVQEFARRPTPAQPGSDPAAAAMPGSRGASHRIVG